MIEVGQSELKDFRQCPLKHKFRWRDGWFQPEAGDASWTGTLWHAVLASHYRAKQALQAQRLESTYTPAQALIVMRKTINELAELYELDEEKADLLNWMAEGYIERWGIDEDWWIEKVEERLVVPIIDPDTGEDSGFAIRFTADLMVRIKSLGMRLAIVDNKSIAAQGVTGKLDLDIDDQLGIYIRGMARLDPNDPPILGMLNQARRDRLKRPMTLSERFFRPTSTRTPRELDEIERDALADLRRMHGAENLRRPSSSPNPRQCGWSCDFKEAHIVLRKSGGDYQHAVSVLQAAGFSNDPEQDPALTSR